jgi:predicted acylesterase/phospholipase RssA
MGSQPGVSPVAAVERLEKLWRGPIADGPGDCGNGVFRLRGLPVQGLQPGCFRHPLNNLLSLGYDALFLTYSAANRMGRFVESDLPVAGRFLESFDISILFDPDPLYQLVETTVSRPGLLRSGKRVAVAASNWQTGASRVFWNEDLVQDDQLRAILASMAIPGIFPLIDIHGVPYVDGGLSMNTPLKPALQAGANVLHVIYLDPLVQNSPVPQDAGTFDALMRTFMILNAAQVESDIQQAANINRGLEILDHLQHGESARGGERFFRGLAALDRIFAHLEDVRPRRPLIIHRYRPGANLGTASDILNFSLEKIDQLIRQGFRDAVEHDCQEEECILPDPKLLARFERMDTFRQFEGERVRTR